MLNKKLIKFLISTLCIYAVYALATNKIAPDINIYNTKTGNQIIFSKIKENSYHYFLLQNPNRLVIDFNNKKLQLKINKKFIKYNLIKAAYSGNKYKKNQLRIVFLLKQNINSLNSYKKHGNLTINLLAKNPQKKVIANKIINYKAKKNSFTPSKNLKNNPNNFAIKKHKIVVVIDPGHGGKDPGATGIYGTHEKNIALNIAKKLAVLLKKHNINAKLTRNTDRFIKLRDRLYVTRANYANIFISIHADAYKNNYARGASIYALSEHGATSEAARWLAQKENHSELCNTNLNDESDVVRSVLINLTQEGTITNSLYLAKNILHALKFTIVLHKNKIEQARFVVLKSLDIPSLLIETGFISNPYEEHKLNTPKYQIKLATAIKEGILQYLRAYPPHNRLPVT